jgi:hypothetical protein
MASAAAMRARMFTGRDGRRARVMLAAAKIMADVTTARSG